MLYFLDTEFIEYPCTIDLISIGIVSEDGRKLYAVSSEFDESKASDWVKRNVISKLGNHERIPKKEIARRILEFVGCDSEPDFMAYYAGYDWVVFCWLFGAMCDLPPHFPKYCIDLKQIATDYKITLPRQESGYHNALEDAKDVKKKFDYIKSVAAGRRLFGTGLF